MLNVRGDQTVFMYDVIKWVLSWVVILPLSLFYTKYLISNQMELKLTDSTQIFSGKLGDLWVISFIYMLLCLIVLYINENKDKHIQKDTLSTVLYLSTNVIWYLILYTLFLANVKRIIGMGSASENTINIILWGTIIFVATQIISRNYLYEHTKKSTRINRKTYLLHRTWIPVSAMTLITILFLLLLYLSNLNKINNLFKTFIIPFIILIGIIITGIVSHFNTKKGDTIQSEEIEADDSGGTDYREVAELAVALRRAENQN